MRLLMIITTTDKVPNMEIVKILGVVHDARTAWASGKSAQEKIIQQLQKQAEELGADAIVGLKIELSAPGGYTGIGTAVKLEKSKK
jgi:uncharacterized protein YbjQ (UPF0145 family)